MSRTVTLVCGPPCAGKTTHVQQHARPGDLVLDQDVIGPTAMREGLRQVEGLASGTAWVIRCCAGQDQREAFAQQIRATSVLLLLPDSTELMARARRRTDPARQVQAVRRWLDIEAGRVTQWGGRDPVPVTRTRW